MKIPNLFTSLKIEPLFLIDEKIDNIYVVYLRNKIFYVSYGDIVAFSVDKFNVNRSSLCLPPEKAICYMSLNITKRKFALVNKHKEAILEHNNVVHTVGYKDFKYFVKHLVDMSCTIHGLTTLSEKVVKTYKNNSEST